MAGSEGPSAKTSSQIGEKLAVHLDELIGALPSTYQGSTAAALGCLVEDYWLSDRRRERQRDAEIPFVGGNRWAEITSGE